MNEQESCVRSFFRRLTCGGTAIPLQLWALYVILFLESFAWFSESISFISYVSEQYHLSDIQAGWAYSYWGVGLSIFSFVAGPIIDAVGFKAAIVLGSILSIAARTIIASSFNVSLTLWCSGTLYALASSLIGPSITIGTKRYMVDVKEQTASYSIQYTVANLGAFLGFLVVDWFIAKSFEQFFDFRMDGLRLLRFMNAFISLICILFSFVFIFMKKTIHEDYFDERIAKQVAAERLIGKGKRWWTRMYIDIMRVFREVNFWRLFVFMLLLLGVRSVFKHLDTTFPKYIIRAIDPAGKYGMLLAINPLIIIVLAPIFTTIFSNVGIYSLILLGTTLSAGSVFLLGFSGTYTTVIIFMVLFSIGEAFHGPRANQYAMRVARDGKEGMYSTLCSLPFFAIKIASGGLSGNLLDSYCPAEGERNCNYMWFLIGLMAISTPILLLIFKRFLDVGVQPTQIHISSSSIETPDAPRKSIDGDGDENPLIKNNIAREGAAIAALNSPNKDRNKKKTEIELEIQYFTDGEEASISSLFAPRNTDMSDDEFEAAVTQLVNPEPNERKRGHRERRDDGKHD